jgi:hypothetical protein
LNEKNISLRYSLNAKPSSVSLTAVSEGDAFQ